MAPAMLLSTAASYVHLGSFPTETAPTTVLTERIRAQARGHDFWGRPLYPGTDDFPTMEVLARLGHGGALAHYMHQLAAPRFARRRIPNYTVLRFFRRSVLLTWNMDGLARDTCSDHHHVVEAHGGVGAEYGSAAGAEWARVTQEYGLEMKGHGLHPIGPERLDDVELLRSLQAMQRCDPTFVMIVGYSFGLFDGRCDDQLAMAMFIDRFRDVPHRRLRLRSPTGRACGPVGRGTTVRPSACLPRSIGTCWRGPSLRSLLGRWTWPIWITSMRRRLIVAGRASCLGRAKWPGRCRRTISAPKFLAPCHLGSARRLDRCARYPVGVVNADVLNSRSKHRGRLVIQTKSR